MAEKSTKTELIKYWAPFMFCIISAIGCLKYAYGLQERVSLCEQKQEQIRKEYDKDISEIKTKLDKIYDFLLNR